MRIWGINKRYNSLSWLENFMSGHVNLWKITIYGENAMNWAVNIRIGKGHLCFTLPTWRRVIKKDGWYVYFSPDATPTASLWKYSTKRI